MCGRFTYLFTWRELHELLNLSPGLAAIDVERKYNVAPTQRALIVRAGPDGRGAAFAAWGLRPGWMTSKPAPINARAETVAASPMFRDAFRSRRCVVPISGFYEWQTPPEAGTKQPWYIHRADGAPLCLAGLWERGDEADTFAVLTTGANAFMAPLHDRMPVVLEPEQVEEWLAASPSPPMRQAADGVLTAHRVSTRVNSARNDDAGLIEPAAGGERCEDERPGGRSAERGLWQ